MSQSWHMENGRLAHEQISGLLRASPDRCMPERMVAKCMVHGSCCPVSVGAAFSLHTASGACKVVNAIAAKEKPQLHGAALKRLMPLFLAPRLLCRRSVTIVCVAAELTSIHCDAIHNSLKSISSKGLQGKHTHTHPALTAVTKGSRGGNTPWWRLAALAKHGASIEEYKRKLLKSLKDLPVQDGLESLDGGDLLAGASTGLFEASEPVPRVFAWGSTPCQSYSAMGKHERNGAESELVHNVWLFERKCNVVRSSEDFYVHENSPNYPPERQIDELADTHQVFTFLVSGTTFGLPYARLRRFTVGFDKKKWRWAGGENPQHEFDEIFSRRVVTSGDTYLMASDQEVLQDYQDRAQNRNNFLVQDRSGRPETPNLPLNTCNNFMRAQLVSQDCPFGPTLGHAVIIHATTQERIRGSLGSVEVLSSCLPSGAVARRAEWAELRARQAVPGPYLCDLDHHPNTRGPQGGHLFPTLVTHSSTYSFAKERLVTNMELFGVHGLGVHTSSVSDATRYPHLDFLRALPRAQQQSLIGNSLLLPAVAAVTLYFLSNLEPAE
eukprot:4140419-Amphidinium_carterae.6